MEDKPKKIKRRRKPKVGGIRRGIWIPDELWEGVDKWAGAEGITNSEFIRRSMRREIYRLAQPVK